MKFKLVCCSFLVLVSFFGFAQEMKEGFTYLETGKYKEAEQFFKVVLNDYPKNKTAKLCFGRAIGLNGKPTEAKQVFIELLATYPNDFEIKLNYAESLLWNKEFEVAENYYEKLVAENKTSFAALLGYANTLSNLKKYDKALTYVNNALRVSEGNANALTSKKYINLGFANQYVNEKNYDKAVAILRQNLVLFENDKETLLNLANVYLIAENYEEANKTYGIIGETEALKLTSLNGLSLVAHLQESNKKALQISQNAISTLTKATDAILLKQTKERYVQALIWNKKYREAEAEIKKLNKEFPNENWVLGLRATLNVYKSDFKKSVADYNTILENDASSFDGNLGKANAQKALGLYEEAYQSAEQTLTFYDNQKDVMNFVSQLDQQFIPVANVKTTYSFDNGNNHANNYTANLVFPVSLKLAFLADGNYRTTSNEITNANAKASNFNLGFTYQILPNLTFKGIGGLTATNSDVTSYNQFVTNLSVNIKPFKLQSLEVGYQRKIEDFNADLLSSELIQNNYFANYNLSTNFNLGWFTQYYFTAQNDQNTRNLFFTSLYYSILSKPVLKTGINYQFITFKDQVPTFYFSPEKFNVVELFVDFLKDENSIKGKGVFYGLNGAFGLQYIEDDAPQNTFRIKANLGYRFSKDATLNVYAAHSNIASATAAAATAGGFQFSEFGLLFKYAFLATPIFKK